MLSCLWDGAYKRTLADNRKEYPMWRSFTIYLMPYNRKQNVLSASLNKTFPFFGIHNHPCLYSASSFTLFACDEMRNLRMAVRGVTPASGASRPTVPPHTNMGINTSHSPPRRVGRHALPCRHIPTWALTRLTVHPGEWGVTPYRAATYQHGH